MSPVFVYSLNRYEIKANVFTREEEHCLLTVEVFSQEVASFQGANQRGVMPDLNLHPNAPCSRSDVVTYLWKLSGQPKGGSSSFTDVARNAAYAKAVAWAVQEGITNGTSETTFGPAETCTRGQIVTFLYRYFVGE